MLYVFNSKNHKLIFSKYFTHQMNHLFSFLIIEILVDLRKAIYSMVYEHLNSVH